MTGRTLRLTVHPGLGKTGTTTLQSALRAADQLWYAGVRSHPADHAFARAFDALLREPLDRWTWRARLPIDERIDALAAVLAEGLATSPSGVGVLSDESILAHVGDDVGWRGPYTARRGEQHPGARVADERLGRLAAVLVQVRTRLADQGHALEVRGFLTVRRHGALLGSSWAWNHEHYRAMGVTDAQDLLRLVREDRFPRLRFSEVRSRMLQSGLADVTVLPLEALREDPEAFWRALSEVLGVELPPTATTPANRRSGSAGAWIVRTVANRPVAAVGTSALLDATLAPLPAGVRGRVEHALRPRSTDGPIVTMDAATLATIDAAYTADNALLGASCPFDLATLGYPVAGAAAPVA
jgi:hypothetical protein